jgi:hypothetical protein
MISLFFFFYTDAILNIILAAAVLTFIKDYLSDTGSIINPFIIILR